MTTSKNSPSNSQKLRYFIPENQKTNSVPNKANDNAIHWHREKPKTKKKNLISNHNNNENLKQNAPTHTHLNWRWERNRRRRSQNGVWVLSFWAVENISWVYYRLCALLSLHSVSSSSPLLNSKIQRERERERNPRERKRKSAYLNLKKNSWGYKYNGPNLRSLCSFRSVTLLDTLLLFQPN
jgi:hypothetical protein